MGLILIYLSSAALLESLSIYLLPHAVLRALLRSQFGFFLLLLGIPSGLYMLGWRGIDFFLWALSPRLLVVDAQGLRSGKTAFSWRDLQSVVRRHDQDRMDLRHRHGKYRLRMHLWSDADHLEEHVTERVISTLLPRVHKQVVAGEEVAFGPLTLSEDGVALKRKLFQWDDIDSIRLQDSDDSGLASRTLFLTANGRLHKVDEEKIVNAPVLLAYLSARLES
ncbi:hypothetical protein MYSTI_03294 [Myxococcus stipitatus DSM 14675]|uniref:Uncharacterized protein n=1 Tax=Myxococcus stipitatus (strain DSM 14675 / JCM 12634 / Mx s8) TaxID=1278073 RepID=L7U6V0_MYXSD|nr:DUF6585 family protein [Myxococcus stipitatus]AGC44606.1 hypothetical protein MYSTI_03294 [Myxococcus stipitatus DSM 14675]